MTRLFILLRSLITGQRSGRLEQLATEVAGYLPSVPALEKQLLDSVQYLEKSVVEVCADFEGMAARARQSVALASCLQSGEGSDVAELIAASRKTLQQLVEQIQRGAEVSSVAIQRMNAVERSSREIVKALAEAERIAFVNKLLALNAKIEAVHVGELGTSFAIVADEIARQAEHSDEITGRILSLMAELSDTAGVAAHDLNEMASVSRDSLEVSRSEVEAALNKLTHTHEDMQRSLDASVSQSEEVSQEVAQAVMALQFQDRVNQRIGHVVKALGSMRESISKPLKDIQAETPWIGEDRHKKVALQLESSYTMNAERSVVNQASQRPGSDGDDIELFV